MKRITLIEKKSKFINLYTYKIEMFYDNGSEGIEKAVEFMVNKHHKKPTIEEVFHIKQELHKMGFIYDIVQSSGSSTIMLFKK